MFARAGGGFGTLPLSRSMVMPWIVWPSVSVQYVVVLSPGMLARHR
jgi:hypothetical protein